MRMLAFSVVLALLSACSTQESHETALGSYQSDRGGFTYDNVHSLSPALYDGKKGKLSVEFLEPARQSSQAMQVNLMLRNRTDQRLVIEARTLFLGANGAPTGDTSAWQRLYLEPKGVADYRETSMKLAEIQHFRIELRESD